MAEANASLSRYRSAIITLALQRAKTAVKHQIQARGHKVVQYSCPDITPMAAHYLDQHRAELLASAKATVECWIAEGVLGKKAQRWFANIRSDAQTAEPQKSITSAVQNSSAEWRADQ
jgi:hypothetical protein